MPHHRRPPAAGALGPYPPFQVIARVTADCDDAGSVYLIAVPRETAPGLLGDALLKQFHEHSFAPGSRTAQPAVTILSKELPHIFGIQEGMRQHRPMGSDLVQDDQGQLYERNGSCLRSVGTVISSRGVERPQPSALEVRRPTAAEPAPTRTFHQFFPNPGEPRILCWGDFKNLLQDQVANPERLRDTHRLSCFAQVYETFVTRTPEAFARECLGDAHATSQIFELSEALAERLKLSSRIPPAPPRQEGTRDGILCAGDRILRLSLAVDPTLQAEPAAAPAVSVPAAPAPETSAAEHLTAATIVAETGPSTLKSSIPERFRAPWEIQFAREKVLADMQARESLPDRLRRWSNSRHLDAELAKWRRQLWGKSGDEQLWGVRPPRGSLRVEEVYEWAKAMLDASAYDASIMLTEWEIFWRQKGL